MKPRPPAWLLTFQIFSFCAAWAFVLGVAAVSLTLQPYLLVVAHNLVGEPVDVDLGIERSAMGSRHIGRGGWAVGVVKVGPDSEVYSVCRTARRPPVNAIAGEYITPNLQQLVVVDIRRCDLVEAHSYAALDPLVYILTPFFRLGEPQAAG